MNDLAKILSTKNGFAEALYLALTGDDEALATLRVATEEGLLDDEEGMVQLLLVNGISVDVTIERHPS